MAAFGEPLFDDTISAWDMGPVVGTLWYAENQGIEQGLFDELDEAQRNTIGYVMSRYGGMTGKDLKRLSHGEPPWLDADAHRMPRTSVKISNESIRAYFLTIQDEDDESGPPSTKASCSRCSKEPRTGGRARPRWTHSKS